MIPANGGTGADEPRRVRRNAITTQGMERASKGVMHRPTARRRVATRLSAGMLALGVLGAVPCRGQDLEPRAYAASPEGAFFLVAGL
jgi:hypothetical protein